MSFKISTNTTLIIFLIFIVLGMNIFRYKNVEKFGGVPSPVFDSKGPDSLFSNHGEYEGRSGFFSYFPFKGQYNSYLDMTTAQHPCVTNYDCNSTKCSQYGYCSPTGHNALFSYWGQE